MKYNIDTIAPESKFVFFWGHQPSKDGKILKTCFSQWWLSSFKVEKVTYKTAEHWMMAKKAELFEDQEILEKILNADSPAEAKKLGREVRNYNDKIWLENRYEIVKAGKELGIKNYKDVISVEIEAFPAIYNFVNNRDQQNNFELIKLMAEDGDIDKIMKDVITSKNYYHHKISIQTKGMFKKEEFITPILNYLNTNPYFEVQQKVQQKNLADKITLNDSLINQIDKLIVLLSSNNSSGTISISEKNSIPELVEKKDRLIAEKQYLLTNENIFDKIIKEESSIINIRDYKPLLLNNKVLFPVILILLYLLSYLLLSAYKNKAARIKS